LESYYPYLQLQEVSKAPTISCTYNSMPKSAKSHFGYLMPLGVKTWYNCHEGNEPRRPFFKV
jgi:hypothetical protein